MSAHHHQHQDNEEYLLSLYEGDQGKLYSGILGHHDDYHSSESKAKIRKIWMVTGILSIITIVEVMFGLFVYYKNPNIPHVAVVSFFLILTVVKAFYIVRIFMHLGDETKFFANIILYPLFILIIWLAIALLADSHFHLGMNETFAHTIKALIGGH